MKDPVTQVVWNDRAVQTVGDAIVVVRLDRFVGMPKLLDGCRLMLTTEPGLPDRKLTTVVLDLGLQAMANRTRGVVVPSPDRDEFLAGILLAADELDASGAGGYLTVDGRPA